MSAKKKKHPDKKPKLHPRNKHRDRYDFKALIQSCPELEKYVLENKFGDESIDFFDADAVKMLNKALLIHFYGLTENTHGDPVTYQAQSFGDSVLRFDLKGAGSVLFQPRL